MSKGSNHLRLSKSCLVLSLLDLTQHLTARVNNTHAPPIPALRMTPLSFERIATCQALIRFFTFH